MNVDQAALFLQALNCKQIRRKSNNWVSAHLASCGKRGALAGDLVVTRGQQEGVNFAGTCLRRVFAAHLAWPRKFCRWIRFCPEIIRRVAGQAMQVHAT